MGERTGRNCLDVPGSGRPGIVAGVAGDCVQRSRECPALHKGGPTLRPAAIRTAFSRNSAQAAPIANS